MQGRGTGPRSRFSSTGETIKHCWLVDRPDYFGLHPKEEIAKAGNNLSVMKGPLGICLVGTHPELNIETRPNMMIPRKLNSSHTRISTGTHLNALRGAHPAFYKPDCFFTGEDLATETVPMCGGCKCGKCLIPGHTLSFKEEQEFHMIRSNLKYDELRPIHGW